MHIRLGYDIGYHLPAPAAMVLQLSVRPERLPDLVTHQAMVVTPNIPVRPYIDGFGNRCAILNAPAGPVRLACDFIIRDSHGWDPLVPNAAQHDIGELPDEVLVYLLGSRYCETDRFHDLAWSLFAAAPPGWARVQAIVAYVHDRITFDYGRARPTKTAFEAHEERYGVCRDFAHLAVTLCRCMNIPARYCTGYLPDIGVPPDPAPMDFCAWFQAYLGGQWLTFDARHNRRRAGRVLMGVGRDATDVAITTTFGTSVLTNFKVVAEEAQEQAKVSAA